MSTIPDDSLPRHAFTVSDYYRMADAGILGPDAHVELIEGEIIDMPPIGSRHAGTVNQLSRIMQSAVGDRAIVQVQNPVRLSEHSEPEPDLALLRPRPDFYKSAHPGPGDVLLVIEVAEATFAYDRTVKAPLYARHGIPEYWIVDLHNRRLERYRNPFDVTYALADMPDVNEPIAPHALPDMPVNLGAVFG